MTLSVSSKKRIRGTLLDILAEDEDEGGNEYNKRSMYEEYEDFEELEQEQFDNLEYEGTEENEMKKEFGQFDFNDLDLNEKEENQFQEYQKSISSKFPSGGTITETIRKMETEKQKEEEKKKEKEKQKELEKNAKEEKEEEEIFDPQTESHLVQLPSELQIYILSNLGEVTFKFIKKSCRWFEELCEEDYVWQLAFKHRWGKLPVHNLQLTNYKNRLIHLIGSSIFFRPQIKQNINQKNKIRKQTKMKSSTKNNKTNTSKINSSTVNNKGELIKKNKWKQEYLARSKCNQMYVDRSKLFRIFTRGLKIPPREQDRPYLAFSTLNKKKEDLVFLGCHKKVYIYKNTSKFKPPSIYSVPYTFETHNLPVTKTFIGRGPGCVHIIRGLGTLGNFDIWSYRISNNASSHQTIPEALTSKITAGLIVLRKDYAILASDNYELIVFDLKTTGQELYYKLTTTEKVVSLEYELINSNDYFFAGCVDGSITIFKEDEEFFNFEANKTESLIFLKSYIIDFNLNKKKSKKSKIQNQNRNNLKNQNQNQNKIQNKSKNKNKNKNINKSEKVKEEFGILGKNKKWILIAAYEDGEIIIWDLDFLIQKEQITKFCSSNLVKGSKITKLFIESEHVIVSTATGEIAEIELKTGKTINYLHLPSQVRIIDLSMNKFVYFAATNDRRVHIIDRVGGFVINTFIMKSPIINIWNQKMLLTICTSEKAVIYHFGQKKTKKTHKKKKKTKKKITISNEINNEINNGDLSFEESLRLALLLSTENQERQQVDMIIKKSLDEN
ncbi:nnp-1 protein putative nuclear protein 1 nop52 [Anaeramoeba flamelloides]|uniref:Nnp-1 protein putative nuclear protein 1 nop52 n=1 Tax=Anaeramoeba flamelloides TaxID=1746091 RepID=A0AAV8A6C3_9EUKA|nr:nnp-1 protein putative nuclear protein 1 nop52 [Anaeramoeba flamelloides]